MKAVRVFIGLVFVCVALAVAVLGLGACVCAVLVGVTCGAALWVLALPFALFGAALVGAFRKPTPKSIDPPAESDPDAEPTE